MKQFIDSFIGYPEGALNVVMYYKEKSKPGDKIKIRISSQIKILKVLYTWGDSQIYFIQGTLFNKSWFNVYTPICDKPVLLKITVEVEFRDGKKRTSEHTFDIN